jgi:sodium transport system ATP-binding protein
VIKLDNVFKSFGAVNAVNGATFSALNGEITALLGLNGAGKTTTLRILYTLIRPERGGVQVDGLDVTTHTLQVRAKLGVLPDAHGLYTRLTVRENIRYFARLHGMADDAIRSRTAELARILAMDDILDRRVEGFSQGERVKTALARALVHDPPNIILDEPTNGLDVSSTRSLREFLLRLKAEGRCVLFSTHVMQEVMALCDRVVIMARGRVVADGPADGLLASTSSSTLEQAFVELAGAADARELA